MVLELLASLSVALVAVAIGLRLVYGDLTLQVGLAVLILAPEAYLPLRQLGTQFHAAADGVAATEKVLAILDTPVPPAGTITDLTDIRGLRLDAVMVGRAGDRGAVGPVSLSIPAGSVTVITGESGSGKTTLLHLLAGVQRPDSGRIVVVDATDRREIGLDQMAPECWHPRLGEGGSGLSQGQRQRLSLARALARPSSLVLLDEPTAALDQDTEKRVLNGIRALAAGRTVVLVTHRPAPLTLAEQVFVLHAPAAGTARRAAVQPEKPALGDQATVPSGEEAALAVGPW